MAKTKKFWQHRAVVQFLEYMVGGGVYFWTGLAIFAIGYNGLHWHWFYAKILADVVGWTLNFLIQRYWAFYDSRLKGQDGRVVFRYILVNGIDIFIDYGIVASVVHFGITPYVGFFISAGFTTVWDYLWYRFWVFKPAI
jgi:putative flippase GtrA